jgi:hypothetical protein
MEQTKTNERDKLTERKGANGDSKQRFAHFANIRSLYKLNYAYRHFAWTPQTPGILNNHVMMNENAGGR